MASISILENAIEEVSWVDYSLKPGSNPVSDQGISTNKEGLRKILKIRSSIRSRGAEKHLSLKIFHSLCGTIHKENNNELKVIFRERRGQFSYYGSYDDPDYTSDDKDDIHATDVVNFSGRKDFPSIEEAFEYFWHHIFLRHSGISEATQKLEKFRLLSDTVSGLRLEPSSHFFGVPRDIVDFCILPFL